MARTKDSEIVKKLLKMRNKAKDLNQFNLVAKLELRLDQKTKKNKRIDEWF